MKAVKTKLGRNRTLILSLTVILLFDLLIFMVSRTNFNGMAALPNDGQLFVTDDACWYEQNHVIANGLGNIAGRNHTNSREAFINSSKVGYKLLEADLALTGDGKLVVRDGFDDNSYQTLEQKNIGRMYYETFMKTPIKGIYTSLDADALIELLKTNPNADLIINTKEEDTKKVYTLLDETIQQADIPNLYNHIIITVSSEEMYDSISGIASFGNYIYEINETPNNYYNIGAFCELHNISAVSITEEQINSSIINLLHSYRLKVFVDETNNCEEILDWTEKGADGIFTDYITPDEYEMIIGADAQNTSYSS